jgi:hypothetical protein
MFGFEPRGVGLPLLRGVPLHERLVEGTTDQRDRLLLEVLRVLRVELAGLLGDQDARLVGGVRATEELVDQRQVHRKGVNLVAHSGEDPVLVTGELREAVDVLPHPLVRRVEQVGAVAVDLDAGFRFDLRVGVAAEVRATFEHEHALAQLACGPFGHGEAEEAGTDDDEVVSRVGHDARG